jgi:hypothetical protein
MTSLVNEGSYALDNTRTDSGHCSARVGSAAAGGSTFGGRQGGWQHLRRYMSRWQAGQAAPYRLARRVGFSESLCEKPRIANRIPTDNPSRAQKTNESHFTENPRKRYGTSPHRPDFSHGHASC